MNRAYLLVICLLIALFTGSTSAEIKDEKPAEYSFSTPVNLKVLVSLIITDSDASGFRTAMDDGGNGNGIVEQDEIDDFADELEEEVPDGNSNSAVNDVFAVLTNTLVRFEGLVDTEADSNSTFTLEMIATATYWVSPNLDKYTHTVTFDSPPTSDTPPRTYIVPEGYRIVNVSGFADNTISNPTIFEGTTLVDDITIIFERIPDNSNESSLSSFSIISGLISIGLLAIFRRK